MCTINSLTSPRSVTATFNPAVQRAFVASFGLDTNNTLNCPFVHPCRTFATAVTVVADNGEVVALDSAGYGSVILTRSIALIGAPGVYAGVAAFAGTNGITINTPNISVVLRGLLINGQGGDNGILMDTLSTNSRLSIENGVIANFPSGSGVSVGAGTVRIVNTLIRDNQTGVQLSGGASAVIAGSKVLANSGNGIFATGATAAISTTAVSDSGTGIAASGATQVAVARSTITNNGTGVSAQGSSGATVVTVSNSMITGNTTGLAQSGTATLELLGNNTVRQNATPTSGTITSVPRM
jgi:hypothetical protein